MLNDADIVATARPAWFEEVPAWEYEHAKLFVPAGVGFWLYIWPDGTRAWCPRGGEGLDPDYVIPDELIDHYRKQWLFDRLIEAMPKAPGAEAGAQIIFLNSKRSKQ